MRTVFILILALSTQITFGQKVTKTRTAALMDGDYSLEGTVYLELYDDNSLDLRFDSDYKTQSNVYDVHVYLSTTNDYSVPIDTSEMFLVANIGTISGLNYSSGAMTFDLPSEVSIDDYEYIVFVCIQYGRLHWGNGTFGESVLSNKTAIDATNKLGLSIAPNPTKSRRVELQFQNPQQNVQIEVLNVNGQIIFSERLLSIQNHFIQFKGSGIYFMRLITNEASVVKKIIIL